MGHRLSKIVTRTGDAGTTGLADGSRVDKDIPRIEAIGTIDELGSVIGFAESQLPAGGQMQPLCDALELVQHDLFDIGDALASPGAPLLSQAHVDRIDATIADWNGQLAPLREFILTGGSPAVGALHMARSTCRRAERRLVTALDAEPQPSAFGLAYLNRLSDLLFVAARTVDRIEGRKERQWESNKSLS